MIRKLLRAILVLGLLAILVAAAGGWYLWQRFEEPYREAGRDEVTVDVAPGTSAVAILRDLESHGLLRDVELARLYLIHVLGDPPLRAGEYRFTEPMTTAEVLDKLVRGEVVTYPATVIEGLDLEETALALARQGFGDLQAFLAAMRDPAPIADLDPKAVDLEGYLYPETYHFARGTSEEAIVDKLVATFRAGWNEEVAPLVAARPDLREMGPRGLVTLASIVEKENQLDEERAVVASVYVNRLRIGMPLQADPTVIAALKQLGTWDGNIRRPDLQVDHPYNTYVHPGLPPGPICSPTLDSILAAAQPADTKYFYFVSRNDGTHVFSESLAEHNRAVDRWQRRYWRERWARERREAAESPSEGNGR